MRPERRIANEHDLELFHESATYKEVIEFVLSLNDAAKNEKNGFQEPVSAPIENLNKILQRVSSEVDAHPAKESASRFGKPEFRDFYSSVSTAAPNWLAESFPSLSNEDVEEISVYFAESFGNNTRIDYGSGHELNFVCFLLCLYKLKQLSSSDLRNLVNGVFFEYLQVMRRVQQAYWLEPAGSHGVWGLDDYHFLPFMFGSAQLINDPYVRPMSIHDIDIVGMYEQRNMYFWCIAFINKVKTVSLRWHSPMLDDISAVKKWAKVNEGMIKMYKAEVLGKLPIVQHFMFGKLLPAPTGCTQAKDIGEDVHVQCWADCCGIRVPSAVAATQSKGHLLRKTAAVPMD